MSAYTVSRLALDAGVSVHIVRDYLLRGLLRPVACTPGGYGLFDDAALQRLCFVRAAFEAGIGLDALARLCRALDAADGDEAAAQLAVLRQFVERFPRQQLARTALQHRAVDVENPVGVLEHAHHDASLADFFLREPLPASPCGVSVAFATSGCSGSAGVCGSSLRSNTTRSALSSQRALA